MFLSSRTFINCSFSLLSYSLYLLYVPYAHNLPILSWANSWLFLLCLQYCKDSIVSMWYGLNFLPGSGSKTSPSTPTNPFLLTVSCSSQSVSSTRRPRRRDELTSLTITCSGLNSIFYPYRCPLHITQVQ